MCQVHQHFRGHKSAGSFHFDNVLKVAFAKYDSVCISTQTDQLYIGEHPDVAESVNASDNQRHQPQGRKCEENNPETRNVNMHGAQQIMMEEMRLEASQKPDSGSLNTKSRERLKRKVSKVSKTHEMNMKRSTQKHSKEYVSEDNISSKPERFKTKRLKADAASSVVQGNCRVLRSGRDKASVARTNSDEKTGQEDCNRSSVTQDVQISYRWDTAVKEAGVGSDTKVRASGTWCPSSPGLLGVRRETGIIDQGTSSNPEPVDIPDGPGATDKKTYKQHRNVHETSETRTYKEKLNDNLKFDSDKLTFLCEVCGKKYSSKKSLRLHTQYYHNEKTYLQHCTICDKAFQGKYLLHEHMMNHTKDQEFGCQQCGRVFYAKSSLRKHIRKVHPAVIQYKQCPQCDKRFKYQCGLTDHLQSHARTFSCDVCGKLFGSRGSRQRHVKIHGGVKPHKCHICGHEFIQKTPYWVHMEKHHDLTRTQLQQTSHSRVQRPVE